MKRARDSLGEALRELSVEDRLVLKMHYQSGLTIAAIAGALDLNQRELYTRRDRCLQQLRRSLEARGLEAAAVLAALGWSGVELALDYDVDERELGETEPSNSLSAGEDER